MAYATGADLVARYDERIVADLASDSGRPAADVSNDPRIDTALEDAAGRILAACLNGQIYTEADLSGLTGSSLSLLKRINCELAMAFLMGRRPERFASDQYRQAMEAAELYLEQLRKGERLFNVEGNVAATVPEIDGPTTAVYNRLNLLPERCRNFYPVRGTRLPLGR